MNVARRVFEFIIGDTYKAILYGVFIFAVYFILRAIIESVSNG